MSDAIKELFSQLSEISDSLLKQGQPSLLITLEEIHRKSLLLSAASYFEFRLSEGVAQFCEHLVGNHSPILQLVRNKAISRQYHTWFDWKSGNANAFFSLFGKDFKIYMDSVTKLDDKMSIGIKSFISLGLDRNRLGGVDKLVIAPTSRLGGL